MALDENDKNRGKFNEDFRKITAAEVKALNDKQKKVYAKIKENQNIAAVPKGKSRNTLLNKNVRLREFDSETYAKVKQPLLNIKNKKETTMAKRRAEANQYKTNLDFPGASKGYNTELGMRVPKSKPGIAPKETRGRKASGSQEKD
jgi:hypothetical protein|tara:strand:+ start:175 stop:612 length:438 start_codon:yes stop_codon:yes gene_type:complete